MKIPFAFYVVALLSLLDAISTDLAIARGAREANVVFRRLFGARPSLAVGILWRALVLAILLFFAGIPPLGWWLFVGLLVYVVVNNFRIYRERGN